MIFKCVLLLATPTLLQHHSAGRLMKNGSQLLPSSGLYHVIIQVFCKMTPVATGRAPAQTLLALGLRNF